MRVDITVFLPACILPPKRIQCDQTPPDAATTPSPPRWTVVLQTDNQNVAKSDTDSQYMIMKSAAGGPK